MSTSEGDSPFGEHRNAEGRLVRLWGHLDVTQEQRDMVQRRMEAWRIFHETGDKTLLIELGIHPPGNAQGQAG